jgi:hypothetical protein
MNTKKRLIVVLSIVLFGLIGASALTVYNYLDNFHIIEPCTTPEPLTDVKGRIVNRVTQLPIQSATVRVLNVTGKLECPQYLYVTDATVQTDDLGEFSGVGVLEEYMKVEIMISAANCQTKVTTVDADAFFRSPVIPDGKPDFYLDC